MSQFPVMNISKNAVVTSPRPLGGIGGRSRYVLFGGRFVLIIGHGSTAIADVGIFRSLLGGGNALQICISHIEHQ